jgi:hypothetical protein
MVAGENKYKVLKLFFNIEWKYVALIYFGLDMDTAPERYNETSTSSEYRKRLNYIF